MACGDQDPSTGMRQASGTFAMPVDRLRTQNDILWDALEAIYEAAKGGDTPLARLVQQKCYQVTVEPLIGPANERM